MIKIVGFQIARFPSRLNRSDHRLTGLSKTFPDKKAIISHAGIRFDFLLPRYATIGSKNMGLIIDSSTNIQILDLLITQSPLAWLSCSFNAESPFRKVNFLFSKMFYFCFFVLNQQCAHAVCNESHHSYTA